MLELDKWQIDVLNTAGNIVLRSGRQVGKSTVISIKAAEYAVLNAKKSIMIISATERQAYLLFSKVLAYIHDHYKKDIKSGKDRPTKSEIKLKNGSIIRCLPTGLDGLGIRGYTVDLLIADEAAFIPQEVWPAISPMLATTGGTMILLSTPYGKQGYFYDRFSDDKFTKFHINSEEVANGREEPQRTNMLENLEAEKRRMSKVQYAQEYLGEFIGGIGQLFEDELIKKCMVYERRPARNKCYLGVDVARMGGDESTFEIIEKDGDMLYHIENITMDHTLTTETTQMILNLEAKYKFRKIYIDEGGMGVAVLDPLLIHPKTKHKVEGINNAKRYIGREVKGGKEKERKKPLMKEQLYMNLLQLMESNRIKLLKDENLFFSLKSIQFERTDDGDLKITSLYGHIAEGLIRAAWCVRDKSLNLWVRWT